MIRLGVILHIRENITYSCNFHKLEEFYVYEVEIRLDIVFGQNHGPHEIPWFS